ncbi:alpha/beta hydrolase [Sedimentisphaera salicampi]|uniref:alpha/beta hydrolase n=1 Tax=Sedimentisphaera salicampi TaxID=1941349 RepID=UPI000B9BBBFA|nr:alpha/beta hydrolase [Sedimentisphaera salicampi]OXU14854.1 Carboxylesterase NlhH [Sedimentisphaera salicampi]
MKTAPKLAIILAAVLFSLPAIAAENYKTETDILYRSAGQAEADSYIKQSCRLDVYYPDEEGVYPSVVWFHGGGLSAGGKYIPHELKEKGVIVAAVNYRLHPKVKSPVYIEDAAASIAWVFENIEKYNGSREQIFVSGHSAGGYLTSMAGLDKSYLAEFGIDANDIAGLIPFSGHTITHFTVRKERGIPGTQPVADEMSPLYHVRKDAPPYVIITGDRELEMLGRYEENAYMWRMMKVCGHKQTSIYELEGYDHGEMPHAAFKILLDCIEKILKEKLDS